MWRPGMSEPRCHLQRWLHQAHRDGGSKETGCYCKNRDASLWVGGIENSMGACTTECYRPDGWTTVTWNRKLSSDRWRQDCTAYVSTSSILPQLTHNQSEILALENLEMAGPLWSMHDEDVVYLTAKEDSKDNYALAVGFNIRKSTVDGVTLFPEERNVLFSLAYQPFALSKFLNMAPAASICWIEEREDSKNDPYNTMILVEELDPCVTVNQLKGIFAMYGELCYLKVLADEKFQIARSQATATICSSTCPLQHRW